MTKLDVIYITIDDVCSGLFSSQVLKPLVKMAEIEPNRNFYLFVINRPWKYLEHRKKLKDINKLFSVQKNIKLKYIPFLPPLRNVTKFKFLSKFATYLIGLILLLYTNKNNSIYHTRGYWPCEAGLLVNLKPMIFEPRSLWNLENIAMGSIVRGTKAELYWNNLEKNCINQSEKIISINTQMVNYFTNNYKIFDKNKVIPISFSKNDFFFDSEKRKEIREKLSLKNRNVFVYSGSFGMSKIGINSIIKTIIRLKQFSKNPHFLFLTPKYESSSVQYLVQKIGLNKNNFSLIHPNLNEISNYLSAADFGYHSLPPQPDSFARMGTKIIEYLAVGLPVIVNKNVGAAAKIIDEQNFGFVIDDNTNNDDLSNNLKKISKINRDKIISYANQEYEISSVAKKYIQVYSEIDFTSSINFRI